MITEDYVSYEVARLFKDKGFDWDCITYYVDSEPNDVKYSMLFENNITWEKRCCSAPTLQMACKWLREVHNIVINIIYEQDNMQVFAIDIITTNGTFYIGNYNHYESAVEAALKYSLENLI